MRPLPLKAFLLVTCVMVAATAMGSTPVLSESESSPGSSSFPVEQVEPQIHEIIVKMKTQPATPNDSDSRTLTAEELAALNQATGLALLPSRVHRDGSQVLQLPHSLGLTEARAMVNAIRMLPGVLYADPLMPGQEQTFSAQSQGGVPAKPELLTQIVVKLRDPQSWEEAAQNLPMATTVVEELSKIAGVALSHDRPMSGGAYVLNLPLPLSLAEAVALTERLEASPLVEYADPVTFARPSFVPNDELYSLQWHYFEPQGGVNLPAAWDLTTGSPGVVVAVVDSGILPNHPDLLGRILPGFDMISNPFTANDGNGRDADATDPGDWSLPGECGQGEPGDSSSWHGTHIAGVIGAASHNGVGGAGVNWKSPILPVRTLGKCGGSTADIADGIRWAAGRSVPGVPANPHPAKVINLSLAGPSPTCLDVDQAAINDALAAGATVVVAAGNQTQNAALHSPGNCNGVITVHATTRLGGFTPYSNFGEVIDVAAPGGRIDFSFDGPFGVLPYDAVLSTLGSGATVLTEHVFGFLSGTSQATAHTTGIASLLLSVNPSLTPSQIEALITGTARSFPVGTGADCNPLDCGTGIIDAAAALRATPQPATPDFSSEGRSDILFRHASGRLTIWLMNGTEVAEKGKAGKPGRAWQVADTGDLNADGRSDIILRHTSGTITTWLMNGRKVIGKVVVGSLDPAWQIVGAGDVNADGTADLLFRHVSGEVAVWLLNGTTVSATGSLGNPGDAWQVAGTGDFNGDRRSDLL
ncbi:MAG: S8 family serine peptidase, partial [Candidatus Binatia bacterium]